MLELDELLEALSSVRPVVLSRGRREFSAIGHDSRNLQGGELFAALRSATGDGHAHAADALRRGAIGLLLDRPGEELGLPPIPELTAILVPDVQEALELFGQWRLRTRRTVVVAGSLGKSTAQACLVAAWGRASGGSVVANGDRNDSLGIPLALSEAGGPPFGPAVLEVVADGSLEERRLARMVQPELVCLTSLDDAKSLYWSSSRALAAQVARMWAPKARLVAPLASARLLGGWGPGAVYFGPLGSGAEVEVGTEEGGRAWPARWSCRVRARGRSWQVLTALHPRLAEVGFGAAVGCLLSLGEDLERGVDGLTEVSPLAGRLRLLPTEGSGRLLDDSFDMSPGSLGLAGSALSRLGPPRLALIGKGREVGGLPRWPFAEVAQVLPSAAPDGEGGIGLRTAVGRARQVLERGGSVLIKGPAGSRMERLVAALAAPGTPVVRPEPGRALVRFRSPRRPTWVEVDLAALAENVKEVASQLGAVRLMAVVKADAYGHGAIQVARTALDAGASWVATATLAEAAELRESGISCPCLVLGYTPPDQVELAARMGLTVTAFDREVLEALAAAGGRLGRRVAAHLKVDTGMSRLGVPPEGVRHLLDFAADAVDLEGIYTHLRKGEDPVASEVQLQRFQRALEAARGGPVRLRHRASSSGWVTRPDARFDMVRLGGELLGLRTADGRRRRPVLAFKTTVAQVRWVEEGEYVGYGDRFRASRRSLIATIPVGYGDGFRRGPATWGSVLIRGEEQPLAGDVCMDMAMVDVTADPQVARGDEVVLIGRQEGAELTVEDVADRLQVLNYELVTQILPRVPREPRWGD
ncbi:MAG: alanine racemase [Candidatus Dormibacteria bacterium]